MGYDAYDRRQTGSAIRLLALVSLAAALLAVPAGASATPSVMTVSATLRPQAFFGASANGSVVVYEEAVRDGKASENPDYNVYAWQDGHTTRVSSAQIPGYIAAAGKGIAISPDGNVIAYAAVEHGDPGTGFYDTTTHARTFLKGYEIGSFLLYCGAQLLSSNGQYALLSLGIAENKPSTYGVYDRATGKFTRIPQKKGVEDHGVSMSANGQVVIYSELKAYKGEVGTVIYDTATHKSVSVKYRSEHIHWLSENGNVAMLEGHGANEGEYDYGVTLYNLGTGAVSGPVTTVKGTFGDPLGFLETPSLTGSGETVAFECKDDINTYNEATKQYSLVVKQGQELGETIITADGSHVIYSDAKANGLYEALTASAPTSTAPTECERQL
jgi:hypothetical protein